MLSEQQIADGWKPHDGGECPVALDSKPGVIFRDGVSCRPGDFIAGAWIFYSHGHNLWTRGKKDGPADIIAYKEQSHAADE